MTDNKEFVQRMFDEISEREGMPRVDLSEDDSAALPFGEEMLLLVQYRGEIPEIDFTVPIGSVPEERKADVYERLLASNFYWIETCGATLAYQGDIDQVVLQFQEPVQTLTAERLQSVLEGFLAVATRWKESLEALVAGGEGEEMADSARKEGDAGFLRV